MEAEEAEAQSLNCEGQHDNQEEIERNAKAAFQEVFWFFQSQATVSDESLMDLIESTYGIQKDVRSRMAFGSHFAGHCPVGKECRESATVIALSVQIPFSNFNFRRSGQGPSLILVHILPAVNQT